MTISFLLLAAGLSHAPWTETLQKFVTPQARVDYPGLKKSGLTVLDGYLAEVAKPWPSAMTAGERKAAMINAYNALTVRWIVGNFPVPSIWRTRHPFTEARHTVNGRKLSLDQLETELRDMGDPRVHAVLVCAARSCPPLRREAYEADRLDAQLDDNTRRWLATGELNSFDEKRREARVSKIFDWYKGDFEKQYKEVRYFLGKYGPPAAAFLAQSGKADIRYRDYYWGLNDSGSAGDSYSALAFYFDHLRNK